MMKDRIDFVITDFVERTEMWATIGARSGLDIGAITRARQLYEAAVLIPIYGSAVQKLGTVGFDPYGFMLKSGTFRFLAMDDLRRCVITGWMPEQHVKPVEVSITCAESSISRSYDAGSLFSIELPIDVTRGTEHEMHLSLSSSFQPSALSDSGDTRHLGFIVQSVHFE